ncbi:MAG: ATP-dependent helicase, partial [Patescibacteria group bacterium]
MQATKNTIFTDQYNRLNKSQKEAVDTIEGPVMVIAGPGTGKTTILTLRIANILQKTDTPPSGILAITYTDAGVKAMRSKLQSIIGDRAYDVKIHTFHGFASAIITEYPDHFIHISDMKQMTDIEQESIIRSIILKEKYSVLRPSGRPDAYLFGILKSIDDAKREAYTPAIIKAHAKDEIEKIKNDESSLSTRGATKGQLKAEARELIEKCEKTIIFADIYEEYEVEKIKQKKLDFNDLIIELLLALKSDELLLRLIQEKYLYIHVDEHQDTNDAQNFIISIIAEFFETPNVFIVGDEKQAIYRFQGASVENFMLLQKRWSDMKLISLDTNYRSHQGILDAGFAMIEKNYEEDENKDLRIKLESGSDEKIKPIDIIVGENMGAMETYLIKEIKILTQSESKASIAIIVKRNRDIDRIINLFEHHNIPVSSERSIDIFNHPVGRLFFDFIEYMSDISKVDLLAKTIIAGMWNISFEKGIEMVKSLKSAVKYDLENSLPQLRDIRSRLLTDSPVGFIIESAEISGFTKIVSKDPNYVEVWRGIVALAESLTREADIYEPIKLIENLLAYRLSAETRIVKVTV